MLRCIEIWIGGDCNDNKCLYHFELTNDLRRGVADITVNADNISILCNERTETSLETYKVFNGLPYQARLVNFSGGQR